MKRDKNSRSFVLFSAFFLSLASIALSACGDGKDKPAYCDDDRIRGDEAADPVMPRATIGPAERPARLIVPFGYDASRAYPLILMLHGYQVNGEAQDLILGLVDRVERYGFALLIPEGTPDLNGRQFWNATEECCNFDDLDVDDVAYLSELVEEAAREVHIDPARVAVVGHSNGGYMAFRLACERPDLFHRVASIAGSMPLDPERCAEREPVSILHIHGSLDDVVPYHDNREGTPGAGHGLISAGARDSVERWRLSNGCAEEPDSVEALDLVSNAEGEETTASSWTSCSTGESVHYFDIEGGDHLLIARTETFQDRIAEFLTHDPCR